MIKSLQHRVEEVESENHHLREENTAMHGLETQLNQAEEQLEYATEENHEYSTRVHALEQALILQETELDNALATLRKRNLEEIENTADSAVGDEELAYREELDAVQEELELMRHERDGAIDRAIKSKIETAKLKAEVSDSCDRVTEYEVEIEHLRMQSSPTTEEVSWRMKPRLGKLVANSPAGWSRQGRTQ